MRAIMHVETSPASPEVTAEYHDWYAVHMREMAQVDGVVAIRRFAPVDGEGRFLSIYEIDADDIDAVKAAIRAASPSQTPPPDGIVMRDPPATVRWYTQIAALPD